MLDLKKATADDLRAYLAEVLPTFDRDAYIRPTSRKLIVWYNLLVASGMTDFEENSCGRNEGGKQGRVIGEGLKYKIKEAILNSRESLFLLGDTDCFLISENQSVVSGIWHPL